MSSKRDEQGNRESDKPTMVPLDVVTDVHTSDKPTMVPEVPLTEFARQPVARRTPVGTRAAQVTLTDEAELERARLLSLEIVTPAEPLAVPPPLAALRTKQPAEDMLERLELGDLAGALRIAEDILTMRCDDLEAKRVAWECREKLAELYVDRLGTLDAVPLVIMSGDELRAVSLDHRAGFLLSHVDGLSSLEMILDVSGMPRLDALRILVELVQKRVVALRT